MACYYVLDIFRGFEYVHCSSVPHHHHHQKWSPYNKSLKTVHTVQCASRTNLCRCNHIYPLLQSEYEIIITAIKVIITKNHIVCNSTERTSLLERKTFYGDLVKIYCGGEVVLKMSTRSLPRVSNASTEEASKTQIAEFSQELWAAHPYFSFSWQIFTFLLRLEILQIFDTFRPEPSGPCLIFPPDDDVGDGRHGGLLLLLLLLLLLSCPDLLSPPTLSPTGGHRGPLLQLLLPPLLPPLPSPPTRVVTGAASRVLSRVLCHSTRTITTISITTISITIISITIIYITTISIISIVSISTSGGNSDSRLSHSQRATRRPRFSLGLLWRLKWQKFVIADGWWWQKSETAVTPEVIEQ